MSIAWGVIGATGIARRRTIPEVVTHARKSRIVAVQAPPDQPVEEVRAEFGIPHAYTDLQGLLEDPQVQAVYLATPVYLHADQCLAAARAGKHVLVEKPLGLNVAQAEQMVAACRQAGVLLGAAYMMRFHACHQEAKRLVAEDRIGQPVMARAQLSCWYPPLPGAWRQTEELAGGGAFMDMGCHCLDLLEYILDAKIIEVTAMMDTLIHDYAVEDAAVVTARFDNGALGVVDNYFCIPDDAVENRLEIYGSGGAILAAGTIGQAATGSLALISSPQSDYAAQQDRGATSREMITPDPISLYAAEMDHMSECIEKGIVPTISGEEGLWNQKLLAACYESAKVGRAVEV
jgi:predicted dehydrogenase